MDGVFLCQKREKQQMMIIIRIVGCFSLSFCLSRPFYLHLDLSLHVAELTWHCRCSEVAQLVDEDHLPVCARDT